MPSHSETYLHGHHDSVLRSHRWRTAENSAGYLLPHLTAGARLLDVGCGPGTITADLAARVGQVTAIDAAEDILGQARAEAEQRGQANVSFQPGDVYHLDFPDGSFDVVHAHQVLQHLSEPVAALAEMRRVCRPGGLVAARDGDYAGMFWYPQELELAEWQALYRKVARALGGEPDAGPAPAGLGARGRVGRGRGVGQCLGLQPVRTGPGGASVGAAADRVAVRGPGRRAWPGLPGGPGAAGPGLAAWAEPRTPGSASRTARSWPGYRSRARRPRWRGGEPRAVRHQ